MNITKREVLNNLIETLEENNLLILNRYKDNESCNKDSYQNIIREVEINTIKGALQKTNGNKKDAAKLLGISRSTLWRKLNETEQ
ncbi:helix-turn-helix domain-containing protein [Peribacillus frigoritolerans]|nr:helix-turn-helix domain-containing protein [Peribacillus frigoritolerans]